MLNTCYVEEVAPTPAHLSAVTTSADVWSIPRHCLFPLRRNPSTAIPRWCSIYFCTRKDLCWHTRKATTLRLFLHQQHYSFMTFFPHHRTNNICCCFNKKTSRFMLGPLPAHPLPWYQQSPEEDLELRFNDAPILIVAWNMDSAPMRFVSMLSVHNPTQDGIKEQARKEYHRAV